MTSTARRATDRGCQFAQMAGAIHRLGQHWRAPMPPLQPEPQACLARGHDYPGSRDRLPGRKDHHAEVRHEARVQPKPFAENLDFSTRPRSMPVARAISRYFLRSGQ